MTCRFGPNTVTCGPPENIPAARHVGPCPLCQRRRRMVTRFDGVYYGTTTYCLACNGREQDGEWRESSGRYAEQDRRYIASLWAGGVDRKTFRAKVAAFTQAYWEEEA